MARPLGLGFLAVLIWLPPASAERKPVTIDAVMNSGHDRARGNPLAWSPDGRQFVVSKGDALSIYDVPSGKEQDVIGLSKLREVAEKHDQPPTTDWTNRRVSESDVQWFPDGKRLLVSEGGDLFSVTIASGAFEQLTRTREPEFDPKLSPDGHYVSFRRGPNLFALGLESKKLNQLTKDGSETLLNGQLDWVYPEELDLNTAHWWSPDSRSIAYLQFDITHEPVFPQVSLLTPSGLLEPERYPKAGDPNAEVRLGVVSALGGETQWMNLGEPRDNLLARVAWVPNSKSITAVKLNRIQNKLDLYLAEVATGRATVILHQEDPFWINVAGAPRFLPGGDQFLWTTEQDGFRHIYLYSHDGRMQKQLTRGEWEVDRLIGLDPDGQHVLYTSNEESPLERQLYAISLDGADKRKLSQGPGTHSISAGPTPSFYLDTVSNLKSPPQAMLHKTDGSEVRVYRKPDDADANEYEILPTEIVKVAAADGTPLYARLIKPAGFQSGKMYPAIVMVYGGPGVQEVRDTWQGLSWDQVLAHKGFVVWQLDNRGSAGRGHKFESVIFRNMGTHELEDQKRGIEHLVSLGFVDPRRIGLYGWSYGGYMTLYTVTHSSGLIKAAIAGAPVTNWCNYDSIYTDRYMGLPTENELAYRSTSPQTAAGELQSKLLIIHNVEDDNVHFANTMQMADALEKANRQFSMLLYPQKTHGVSGPARRHLLEETTSFFEANLK
ncbi:MAG: DPP IV N-terminal domain-containing protein [Bryobacteraceae bacterium]